MVVNVLENRNQLIYKQFACVIDGRSVTCHLPLPDVKKHGVGFVLHLQKRIALLQCLVVVGKGFEVVVVVL